MDEGKGAALKASVSEWAARPACEGTHSGGPNIHGDPRKRRARPARWTSRFRRSTISDTQSLHECTVKCAYRCPFHTVDGSDQTFPRKGEQLQIKVSGESTLVDPARGHRYRDTLKACESRDERSRRIAQ